MRGINFKFIFEVWDMENDVNGVSLKELFINCIWKSDSHKTVSKEASKKSPKVVSATVSEIAHKEDTEWKKVLQRIDEQERSMRNGEPISNNKKGRKTNRTNSLEGMQVNKPSKGEEKSIRQNQENNIDREREE